MRRRTWPAAFAAAVLISTGAAAAEPAAPSLVVLVADGIGVGGVSAVSALARADGGRLHLESLPVVGLVRTSTADTLVTDSAAAATALATGERTGRGMLSILPDGRAPRTLLERAAAADIGTGVITTSGLLDATPAGFATHAHHRDDWPTILAGMLASPVDLMLGGDWDMAARAPHSGRAAAVLQVLEGAPEQGVTVVRSAAALRAAPEGRVLGWFPAREEGGDAHGPTLAETTRWALERLGAGGRFVLLVETEETDEGAHANDMERVRAGLEELDAALAVALEWQADHPDTLVVVLSDHDTGGPSITGGTEGLRPRVSWGSEHHTGEWVPLFAGGPGAASLGGVRDNSEIGAILRRLLGLEEAAADDVAETVR